jgi:membrane associated rhomboid family serine protease
MSEQAGVRTKEPFFGDVPGVVVGLGGAIALVSALALAGPRQISDLIQSACVVLIGLPPGQFEQPLGPLAPYVLHVFVHGGWLHLALNLLGLAAFGAATARRLRSPLLFLTFFFLCSAAGAAAESLRQPVIMLGASSGVFGLVAGATYVRGALAGLLPPLMSRVMLVGLAPWVAINLLLAAVGGGAFGYASIAWLAHLGGLAAGAVAFPVFDRIAHARAAV